MSTRLPAYVGHEPFIFVCYSHADVAVVYPEIEWLQGHGQRIWYDEGISGGRVWRQEIADALDHAERLIFYVSRASVRSSDCRREVHYAIDRGLDVLPVYLENVELPGDLRIALNLVQALFPFRDDHYREHLLAALGRPIEQSTSKADPSASRSTLRRVVIGGLVGLLILAGAWVGVNRTPAEPDATAAQKPALQTPKLAVLPLQNISGDPAQDYFTLGVTQEIWNQMTRFSGVRVIAMTSSQSYRQSTLGAREIGKQLSANYLIEGTVNRSGNTLRVRVSLIDASDGTHVLGGDYEKKIDDVAAVFALYDEIAGDVGTALSEFIGERQSSQPTAVPTRSLAAYELILQAITATEERGNLVAALEFADQALALDPSYTSARAYRASIYFLTAEWGVRPAREMLPRARSETLAVLSVSPDEPLALFVLGLLRLAADLDFSGAMQAFDQAEAGGAPRDQLAIWRAIALMNANRPADALTIMRAGEIVDPLNPVIKDVAARCLYMLGDVAAGNRVFDEALALQPENVFEQSMAIFHSVLYRDLDRARRLANAYPHIEWGLPFADALAGDATDLEAQIARWYPKYLAEVPEPRLHMWNFLFLYSQGFFLLGDYAAHIGAWRERESRLQVLHFTNWELSTYEDYWPTLEMWAAGDPERTALLSEHRERIARITRNMKL